MNQTLKEQVTNVLALYPQARNSDRILQAIVWAKYYSHLLEKDYHASKVVYSLPNFVEVERAGNEVKIKVSEKFMALPLGETIKRVRAEIQNQDGEYLPTDLKVAKARRINEEAIHTYYALKK